MKRRAFIATGLGGAIGGLGALGACRPQGARELQGGWIGASFERGHRLQALQSQALPPAARVRRVGVIVVGAGIAGLGAARALAKRGIDDIVLLDLEDAAGGNSRGHALAGMRCPLGAHYLPLPGPQAIEVGELLYELGLLRSESGRVVADERHLCHSPQERLFFDGAWHEGLLPPADGSPATLDQYRRFAQAVDRMRREIGFALPSRRAPWTAAHDALDSMTFAGWLERQGFDDARLRWYLDYACRDDYGADAATASAWAGLHYFGSRHGFHAPGDDGAEREPVFTWPEGNAWLAERLAAPFARERLRLGQTVLRVAEGRHDVQVLAWDPLAARAEAWTARAVVLAVPLFVAARLLEAPPAALTDAAATLRYAPWLVANLHLQRALVDRPSGAAPSWDNVRFGSPSLGYVDAMHQSLRPHPGPTVITAYWALPMAERAQLLANDWRRWAQRVVDDLAVVHPDLPAKLERIDLMRYGHAMSIPRPGVRASLALRALAEHSGRVVFAHADLCGYSVFEEAYTAGVQAAGRLGPL